MDSHLLTHSNCELDYRANKKTKLEGSGEETCKVEGGKSEGSAGDPISSPHNLVNESPGKCSVSSSGSLPYTSHNTSLNTPSAAQHSSGSDLDASPQCASSQSSNLLGSIASATVASQPLALTLPTSIISTTNNTNGSMTHLTTMSPSGFTTKPGSTQKQEPLYRCRMCHHFTTNCQGTLHQHIKHTHNTCQECGYTSDNITELSLHVCHSYDGQSTYTNAILGNSDNLPPINFSSINSGYPPQQTGYNTAPANSTNAMSQPQPAPTKKRPNRQIVDDDFQQGIYRCRKCNYGTSWKCFLDSHMLTHGGVI